MTPHRRNPWTTGNTKRILNAEEIITTRPKHSLTRQFKSRVYRSCSVTADVRQERCLTQVSTYDRFAIITRDSFANFLDRYADNKTGAIEWDHFVVQHYGDSFLEEVRRCVVRLAINKLPIHGDTDAARDLIRSWATLLRSSTNSDVERKPDVATIDMTPAEAVLLDSILRRYSGSQKLTVENVAEQQCLWNLQCLLEKHGDQSTWPCIEDATAELTPEDA